MDGAPGGGGGAQAAIRTVAVIGAGRVGRSFALAAAAAGFDVVLEDVMPARLRRAQEEYADLAAENAGGRGSASGCGDDRGRGAGGGRCGGLCAG